MAPDKHYHVLLVEDHPADVVLTRKAFSRIASPSTIHVAIDGIDAMQFLRREGRFKDAVRPDIVLLDLNMPRRDGRAVLRDMKADESLRSIPVVVLTTSAAAQDVKLAYNLHANGYISKPVAFKQFQAVVEAIERFWFQTVILP